MSTPTSSPRPTAGSALNSLPELPAQLQAQAIALAEKLLADSLQDTKFSESSRSKRMSRLLADSKARDLLLDMTDQVMRIRDARRSAQRLNSMTAAGVPSSLGTIDSRGLAFIGKIAPVIPNIVRSAINWRVDQDASAVILPAEDPAFTRYVRRRTADGFRLNINLLGEAILSDAEAEARCQAVLERIARPDVNYLSVKISAICANLDVLAEADSLERIAERLRQLYRAAAAASPATFINLDMEEYRDLELSLRSFMRVLDEPEFLHQEAGIVLQAYIPDSHDALARLITWANERQAKGGAAIKVRLVKGANLAMELVESESHGWESPCYPTKSDVDASYKRMLHTALAHAKPGALRLGIASHNLFDVAWALTLREHFNAQDTLELEMLEGMAPPQARAVRDAAGALLLYAPVVAASDREACIAYLSRRLDENSAPENFLKSLFTITPGSDTWEAEKQRFTTSLSESATVSTASRRTQNRATEVLRYPVDGSFENVADTDFTVDANREWALKALANAQIPQPALVEATAEVDTLLAQAQAAATQWRTTSWELRRTVLAQVAEVMERRRDETLAVMAHTTGKTLREGDPEISEAIDFALYAAHLTVRHEQLIAEGLSWTPHSTVVVAGPWNFPYAIPASGLVHSIAAGSAVILKPAPEARAVAAALVDQLHEAGVPEHLVQLACTPDNEVGQHLITHDAVDMVMLTGSLATAELFTGWKPELNLHAETSGKNALIITQAADIDQAIKDLVKSAFGHAGQKCSAASLAIVEAAVYDDPSFSRRLADAVASVTTGSATDPATIMGPIINPATGPLERALTTLEPGESWLVEPTQLDDRTWTPAVRWDVQPGSWFHLTECFGPVLGVMRAPDLATAIEWQNAPIYGLTGGIHSLDPAEIAQWRDAVQVGNAYINRHITGAIVGRQPFGGWKASSVGASTKPGGPHHLHAYGTFTQEAALSPEAASAAMDSYKQAWAEHFTQEHDPTGLVSESNILRYRPIQRAVLVFDASDPAQQAQANLAAAACSITGTQLTLCQAQDEPAITQALATAPEVLRTLSPLSTEILAAAHTANITIDAAPVTTVGFAELSHWVHEQAISRSRHRYGRLID